MRIEEAYYAKLTSVAGISAIVSTRVFPLFVPQSLATSSPDTRFPCITYTCNLEVRGKSYAGTNGLNKTNIETICWQTTIALARTLRQAVVDGLKNQYKVTWGTSGVKVSKCDIENDDETIFQMPGNDGMTKYGAVLNASVWYMEQ